MTLFELTESYKNILDLIENDDVPKEIVEEALNSLSDDISVKCENICKLIKTINGDIDTVSAEIKRLTDKKKALSNKIESLKSYIYSAMKFTNTQKVKTPLFSISIKKNPGSVLVEKAELIPEEYLIQQEPLVNKKAILAELKEGKEISGVSLKESETILIR